jgi:hypothetical protein
MTTGERDGAPALALVELVRCLGCEAVYSKPAGGGTVRENPGCPVCGYVGWLTVPDALVPGARPYRSAGDPQPGHVG